MPKLAANTISKKSAARLLSAVESQCECWDIKLVKAMQFSIGVDELRLVSSLNGRKSPLMCGVKYLIVVFKTIVTGRLLRKTIEAMTLKPLLESPYLKVSSDMVVLN
jgi:hypothetical protein